MSQSTRRDRSRRREPESRALAACATVTVVILVISACVIPAAVLSAARRDIAIATTSTTQTTCTDRADGAATISVTGGTPPYNYTWSTGAPTQNITGVLPGTYNVTVVDSISSIGMHTLAITSANPELVVDVTVIDALCAQNVSGPDTTSLYAVASGGSPPYTYFWEDVDTATGNYTTQNLTGLVLTDTTFRLTVTDNATCTNIQFPIVDVPPFLSNPSVEAAPPIPCLGGGVGGVNVTVVVGGTPPYSYLWSTGGTARSISGVLAGTYIVTITDANGCTSGGPSGGSFELENPASPPC